MPILAALIAALEAAQSLAPAIEALIPIVEKLANGTPTTDADLTTVINARLSLEAQALPPSGPTA